MNSTNAAANLKMSKTLFFNSNAKSRSYKDASKNLNPSLNLNDLPAPKLNETAMKLQESSTSWVNSWKKLVVQLLLRYDLFYQGMKLDNNLIY